MGLVGKRVQGRLTKLVKQKLFVILPSYSKEEAFFFLLNNVSPFLIWLLLFLQNQMKHLLRLGDGYHFLYRVTHKIFNEWDSHLMSGIEIKIRG